MKTFSAFVFVAVLVANMFMIAQVVEADFLGITYEVTLGDIVLVILLVVSCLLFLGMWFTDLNWRKILFGKKEKE